MGKVAKSYLHDPDNLVDSDSNPVFSRAVACYEMRLSFRVSIPRRTGKKFEACRRCQRSQTWERDQCSYGRSLAVMGWDERGKAGDKASRVFNDLQRL